MHLSLLSGAMLLAFGVVGRVEVASHRTAVQRAYETSLEVEVKVYSEETLTGTRRMTSQAYLTFVAVDGKSGSKLPIPPLLLDFLLSVDIGLSVVLLLTAMLST